MIHFLKFQMIKDVTDPKSFENLNNWKSEFLRQISGGNTDNSTFPFVVLGNKVDRVRVIISILYQLVCLFLFVQIRLVSEKKI